VSTITQGTLVGGFRIRELLGAGAMGTVYLAESVESGDPVAVKIIAAGPSHDTRFRERFERECALAASLRHPNVVATFTSGETDGHLYLAMEYVDGSDLREILRREAPLDPARALRLLAQVADALDAAHELGLVHRDVKPGNILVTERAGEERALVCDFGLARHVSSVSSLTGDRGFVGTIDYVPPEQIQGNPVDRRSDLYSLGCVLFECLVGAKPFERESELSVVFAHLNDPPPRPTEFRPELPAAWDEFFTKALAKSPDDRFDSCRDLLQAARSASRGNPLPRPRRRRLLALAAAIVVVAAVAAGSTIALESGSAHVTRITPNAIDGVSLGHKTPWYRHLLGPGPPATDPLSGYAELHFQQPEIATYSPRAGKPAVILTTWNPNFRTAAGIGPCSTLAAMRSAYGDRVTPDAHATHGKNVTAWKLGTDILFETQDQRTISAVVLFRPVHGGWANYFGQNETACK
jgi:serine/threonine-protein kinase